MNNCNNAQFTIGLDFGSLSCRGVLVNIRDGSVMAEATMDYPHAVIDSKLPNGTVLNGSWCLQHPEDFVFALEAVVRELMRTSRVAAKHVVGIGVDCTASTVLPVDEDFRPMSENPAFANHPHAWVKMWKHHGASEQAEKLTKICRDQYKLYLDWYGGSINSECLLSKVIQVFDEDRDVFDATAAFIEIADYLTSLLVNRPAFSTSIAAAKAFWSIENGYPDGDFYAAVDPALRELPKKLMECYPERIVKKPGECVGGLCNEMAEKLGLCPGIAVSAAQMDGYAPMPGLGIVNEAELMMIVGTSTGIMLLSRNPRKIKGVTACLPDTYYPGFWGYASGQASVGDSFQWFSDNCIPSAYVQEAKLSKLDIQQLLMKKAERLSVGESGVIALEWINGNKSVLSNSRLSAMFLGIHLGTKAEHLYRALIEATAFGARIVVEAFQNAGEPVEMIRICGGIPEKNPLMMQIYADVLGMPLFVSHLSQAAALGMSIYAAAAAGVVSGYKDIFAAVKKMSDRRYTVYTPQKENQAKYNALYQEYLLLHDYFGHGENCVMERLYAYRNKTMI